MSSHSGARDLERIGGKDLNQDGRVINLVIVGSSRFYDYSVIEESIEDWIETEAYPDVVIVGGASGVDYLAERWANNHAIPFIVFSEQWNNPRPGLHDSGRGEAPTSLTDNLLDSATHILAFPSPTSKWTRTVINLAKERGIPLVVREVE